MSALVLDSRALVAVDRGQRAMAARLRVAERDGIDLRTTGVVLAEVWRDAAGRQASLARLLKAIDVRAVDERIGREAGMLLGKAGATDAADATVVAVAASGDRILTGDPGDLGRLAAAAGRSLRVVPC